LPWSISMTSPPPFDRQPADSTTRDPAARTGLPASVAMSMARWPAQKYWVITAPGTGQRSLPVPTTAEYGAGAGAGAVTWATWAARLGVGAGGGLGAGVGVGRMRRYGSGSAFGSGWMTKIAERSSCGEPSAPRTVATTSKRNAPRAGWPPPAPIPTAALVASMPTTAMCAMRRARTRGLVRRGRSLARSGNTQAPVEGEFRFPTPAVVRLPYAYGRETESCLSLVAAADLAGQPGACRAVDVRRELWAGACELEGNGAILSERAPAGGEKRDPDDLACAWGRRRQ